MNSNHRATLWINRFAAALALVGAASLPFATPRAAEDATAGSTPAHSWIAEAFPIAQAGFVGSAAEPAAAR